MSKLKYEILLPKGQSQLDGILSQLIKTNSGHLIIKILNEYIDPEELKKTLEKYKTNIQTYKLNYSIVILHDDYNQIPDFIAVAPTEEEAIDIIEFEEIERDLFNE